MRDLEIFSALTKTCPLLLSCLLILFKKSLYGLILYHNLRKKQGHLDGIAELQKQNGIKSRLTHFYKYKIRYEPREGSSYFQHWYRAAPVKKRGFQ
jgi:hypothetical protein